MNKLIFLIALFVSSIYIVEAQIDSSLMQLPYYEIPTAPESFTAGAITSRMVDGLGFRYYWATESLRAEDLSYKASESGRTSLETLDHIHGLSQVFLNAVRSTPNGNDPAVDSSYEALRQSTLINLQTASQLLLKADLNAIENMKVIFVKGEKTAEYPFWNALNGPLEDALWHVGQIISMRRASGNPFNSKVSVFSGKVRN